MIEIEQKLFKRELKFNELNFELKCQLLAEVKVKRNSNYFLN